MRELTRARRRRQAEADAFRTASGWTRRAEALRAVIGRAVIGKAVLVG